MISKQQNHHKILLRALTHPEDLSKYSFSDWELLIRLIRKVKLLGHLATELNKRGLLERIPIRAANQLRSGLIQAKKRQQHIHWELNRVLWALGDTKVPIVALKGTAYALAGLPEADARVYVDLDLMVSRENLANIESVLIDSGWQHPELSAYDEYYYRVWSHEIPPLTHSERATEVDIHHTIAPLTSKLKINTKLFFEAAVAVKDKNIRILGPVDMVLHCAVNLFQNNELTNDLRDLLDFHHLLLFFSKQDADFWGSLKIRSNQLHLGRSLFYCLHFSRHIFETPIPDNIIDKLNERPAVIKLWIMNGLVPLALFPLHPDDPSRLAKIARFLLYLRSHLIRMPLYLLLPHLMYKTFLAFFPRKAVTTQTKN